MTRRAAIDIGTNSVRLLLAEDGRDLARRAVITRLGAGVDRTRRLDPEAIDRTLAALHGFRMIIDAHGVEHLRVVATSAARDADNRDAFFTQVTDVLDTAPELLSGDEEARLSFAGAVRGLPIADAPFLVVDVGGGSTELAIGAVEAEETASLDLGCVRLTEAELHHDPPSAEELANALGSVADTLEDALRALPDAAAATVVGAGGTITTMAAVEIGLVEYDRDRVDGFALTRDAAEDVFRTLATEPLAARVHNPGLQPARADVIVGGCCIVVGVMRALQAPRLIVRDADLLDALVAGSP
jgi:exopolyphosphatase/guanosine-5'-triphosphate,3'-diphosphate pyrophosphatase